MSEVAEAMVKRAREVRTLGEWIGFFEFIVWAELQKVALGGFLLFVLCL